ncbi:uracil-xanthine permease family protein [Candidatus Poriferisodalis sp.]|uniref:uracil-xanthine permease family protein n=1 Tax=Candidatus Poriferisodalis sp. TaxID=3101277 RepID=UPI003B023789
MSLAVGAQGVLLVIGPMVVLASIPSHATQQSSSYISWTVFVALLACGVLTALQALRMGPFGAGLLFIVGVSPAFVAVSALALAEGGPVLLASLTVVSAFSYFLLAAWLPRLRKVITPLVAGIVLMLIGFSLLPVAFGQISSVPAGKGEMTGLITALVTVATAVVLALLSDGAWRIWSPLITISAGCAAALLFGILDTGGVADAPWLGLPTAGFHGFAFEFGASFWTLLPVFALVALVDAIKSIGDGILMQQQSWRLPRVTDYRRIQGSINATGAGFALAAAMGSAPLSSYGSYSAALSGTTQVASRRVGVYLGSVLVLVALMPKLMAVLLAVPGPVAGAYLLTIAGLLFVSGVRNASQGGLSARDTVILSSAFALGAGIEHDVVVAELVGDVWEPLASNGLLVGAFVAIAMNLLTELVGARKRHRFDLSLSRDSLPELDGCLVSMAERVGWSSQAAQRLRATGEETLLCLLDMNEQQSDGETRRLVLLARPGPTAVHLEFIAIAVDENLEDRLACLSEEIEGSVETTDPGVLSLRLLQHYTSGLQHQKYLGMDIVNLQVSKVG